MATGLHISINAEPLFHIGSFTVTNSIFTTWVVSALLIAGSLFIYSKTKDVSFNKKPTRFQSIIEMIIEGLYGLVQGVAGSDKKTRIFFPLVATFFLFILFSNWFGLLPGVGTIGFQEKEEIVAKSETKIDKPTKVAEVIPANDEAHPESEVLAEESPAVPESEAHPEEEAEEHTTFVPYFRGGTADLNTTIALALFSVLSIQMIGFKFLKIGYAKKFFDFSGVIPFFIGFLELFSETSKIVSFAFRLFGNIFAGEVLLAVIMFLTANILPGVATLPFYGLEIFVGFIQALVFAMLTLVFLNIAATSHHAEEH